MNTDIEEILKKYPNQSEDSLIAILQDLQKKFGYLSREAMTETASWLHLPCSRIYSVATFYNQFRFQPTGKYHLELCRGTACHVKGSARLLQIVLDEWKLEPGNCTPDGLFSLELASCLGACGSAPVLRLNGKPYSRMTPEKLRELMNRCAAGELKS